MGQSRHREREVLRYMRAQRRAAKHFTVSVHTCTPGNCDRPDLHEKSFHERLKEESEALRKVTLYEMHKEAIAAMRGEVYPPEQ